jgi:hypothetical protein
MPSCGQTRGMSESEMPLLPYLLWIAVGMMVVLVFLVLGMLARLRRIERMLMSRDSRPEDAPPNHFNADSHAGGAFEMFLNEDPERRNLPKGEQFAAYRQWRQEKGLNWSGS